MGACANHSERKSYAKGLCKSCYHKALREANESEALRQKEYFAKLYAENSERKKAQSAEWARANKAKKAANDARYRVENAEKCKEVSRRWKRANFARVLANNAGRRAVEKRATPVWADKQAINNVYEEARYMQMHVDHIVPLNHPLVCGLHVWDNLQLMNPEQNMRKNNRFDPETYYAD